MNEGQKDKIHLMRKDGQSYSSIASVLGISENTIKSYCRRNNLGVNKKTKIEHEKQIYTKCKYCGKALVNATKGQPRKFCTENCRRLWWKENECEYDKKAYYTIVCAKCGKEFKSYGNKNRRFCSHACYINHRFKGERDL